MKLIIPQQAGKRWQAALANARSAAADENASQTQIDQALDDLNAAISALVEKHIWQTVTIAWSDNIAGLFTSMDTDSFGRPHISYYDATDGDLMYVCRTTPAGTLKL